MECPILFNYGDSSVGIAAAYGRQPVFLVTGNGIGTLVDFLDSSPHNRNPPRGGLTRCGLERIAEPYKSPSFSIPLAERDDMSDRLEFRHLRYLIAVAEEANISRAARRLYLAQPSLSTQIKALEEALLIDLLVRVPKGVKLTPAAEVLIAGARQILKLRDEMIAAARASHQVSVAPLRIGFSPFVDCALLQMVCTLHNSLFPDCEITPKSGDTVELLSMVEHGAIDAALLTLPANGIGLNMHRLARDRLVVCMRSKDPAADQIEIAPSALQKMLTIFREPKQHPEAHRQLMEMLDEVGVHPEVASTTATPHDIQWMVQSGYGHALIREGSELEAGVITRPVAGVDWTVESVLIFKKSPSHKTIPVLVRELRKRPRLQSSIPPAKQPQSVRARRADLSLSLFG